MEKNYNLVVVDNDQNYLTWVCAAAKSLTPNVRGFSDPSLALSFMEECPPCLLIMKIDMPRLDGKAMCEIMRKSTRLKAVPIVLISGDTTIGDFSLYFKGVDFVGSNNIGELLSKVKLYCGLKQTQDKLEEITNGIH